MKNEWEEESGGGEPRWKLRVVSGITRGGAVEGRQFGGTIGKMW